MPRRLSGATRLAQGVFGVTLLGPRGLAGAAEDAANEGARPCLRRVQRGLRCQKLGQENWALGQAAPGTDQFGLAWLPGGPASAYSIVYICTTFSLPTDPHLGCVHVLAIVNKAAINVGVQIHFPDSAFILVFSLFFSIF